MTLGNKPDKRTPALEKAAVHLAAVRNLAREEREACFQETGSAVNAQAHKTRLDDLLTDLASLQSEIGQMRKACSEHIQTIRVANPSKRGRPVEGEERVINGKTYIFTGGRFYLTEATTNEKEKG